MLYEIDNESFNFNKDFMKMQKINNCRQNRLEFENFALFFASNAPEDFPSHVNTLIEGLDEDNAIANDLLVTGAVDTLQ